MSELKPCPFCGGPPSIVTGGPGNHFVQCMFCRATSDDMAQDRAIAAWNSRAPAPTVGDDLVERRPGTDHPEIWLEPLERGEREREWCQHNVWDTEEHDGETPTKYVRADIAATALTTLRERVARLEGGIEDASTMFRNMAAEGQSLFSGDYADGYIEALRQVADELDKDALARARTAIGE